MHRAWLGLVIAAGMVLTGCVAIPTPTSGTNAVASHVDVTFWHTETAPAADDLNKMVEAFNASHPEITVKLEFAGSGSDEYRKLLAAAKTGGLPDIVEASENVIGTLARGNLVAPLDPYIAGPDGLSKASLDDIFPGYLQGGRFHEYGNAMLSFPFAKSELMAYYNSAMLAAAGVSSLPQTWDEFAAAVKKLGAYARTKGLALKGAYALNGGSNLEFAIISRGGSLLSSDETQVAFNDDQGLQALQLEADLGKSKDVYLSSGSEWLNDFASQSTAVVLSSTASAPLLDPLVKKSPKPFRWVLAPPPSSSQKATLLDGADVAILKGDAAKQAAAWQFIKWFTDTSQTASWALQTHYLPARASVTGVGAFQNALNVDAVLKASFEYLQYAQAEPKIAGWQEVSATLQDAESAVIAGKMTPKAALDDAATRANKALADARP